MIWKLSLTGIKSRLKDYAVLFSGLIVASMIIYMFLTIAVNPGFMSNDINAPAQYLSFIFGFGIVLLAIISLVYLVYANTFLLSMRKHDYGMFIMLGAKSSKIGLLIFCETLLTGLLATVIGILIGFALTGIVSKILIANLGLKITHFQIILPEAILGTLIFFIIVFFLAAFRNMHKLIHSKVIDLLHEDQKPVKLSRRSGLKIIEAVLGLILLTIGYYVMGLPMSGLFMIIPVALVTIVLGSYFIFDSLITLIINFFLKKKDFAYRGIRMFTLGQLKFRIRDYTRILSVISLLFALALGAITVGLNFDSMKQQAIQSSYYDAVVIKNSQAVEKQESKLNIKTKAVYNYVETKKEAIFNAADFAKHPVKNIEFVQHGNDYPSYKLVTLKPSEIVKSNSKSNYYWKMLVPVEDKKLKIVSAKQFVKIQGKKRQVSLIKVKDFVKDYLALLKLVKMQMPKTQSGKQAIILTNTKPFAYQASLGFASGFEFMGFFLGIAFLTMLASTLMFKVLSGAASDKLRYEMLYKIGARQAILKRSIKSEIGILFSLPAILGIIDVLYGLRMFNALLPKPYAGIGLPFTIFIVLYLLCYLVTVKLYENIVLRRQRY